MHLVLMVIVPLKSEYFTSHLMLLTALFFIGCELLKKVKHSKMDINLMKDDEYVHLDDDSSEGGL